MRAPLPEAMRSAWSPPKEYTIEDLYRDSPTDTPFLKMVEAMNRVTEEDEP